VGIELGPVFKAVGEERGKKQNNLTKSNEFKYYGTLVTVPCNRKKIKVTYE